MDNLPLDLKKEIATYFNYETKLAARLASKEWYQIVHINDYILYNITTEEWNEFVKRVSKLDTLYSLDLRQNVFQDIDSLSQVVTKFTQLTSLKVEQFPEEFLVGGFGSNYVRSCYPLLDIWLNLPNLRDITLVKDLSPDQLEKFRSLTKLERFSLMEEQPTLAPFQYLTTEFKYLTKIEVHHSGDDFFRGGCSSIFNQIRELSWRKLDPPVEEEISLIDFTSLESLSFFKAPFDFINSSRLTSLTANNCEVGNLMNSRNSLISLKKLDIEFPYRVEESLEFFTMLTDLEDLRIFMYYDGEILSDTMLSYLNSTRLTHLSNRIVNLLNTSRNLLPLAQIPSLTSVDTCIYDNDEMIALREATQIQRLKMTIQGYKLDLDLSKFLNLESLIIEFGFVQQRGIRTKNFVLPPTLTQLQLKTTVEVNTDQMFAVLDLSLLSDLKVLQLSDSTLDQFSGFEELTRLEEFSFSQAPTPLNSIEISFLTKWTNLQTFSWSLRQSPLPYMVNASKLQSLTISQPLESFQELDYLTVHTRLTYLELSQVPAKADADLTNTCLTRLTKLKVCCITPISETEMMSNDQLRRYLPRLFN